MTVVNPTTETSPRVRRQVQDFVRRQALLARKELGFSWVGTPIAPSTYQQLRSAFAHSAATGEPLPISNEHCDSTIFPMPSTNVLFRFWHDVSHVRLGLSFNLDDELELALWHLEQLERAGYAKGSDAYRLLESDVIGQVLIMALARRFAIDQRAFSDACIEHGLMQGLLHEIRRLP